MLSDAKEKRMKISKKDLPLLPAPRTVRVRFRKIGNLEYISHLDLQRTISRVLVRAGIPMWYTQGFNPHAKITYALPLSVGAGSECEYLDLRIDREMSCEEIRARLNAELTDELCALDVYEPPVGSEFQSIAYAAYEIRVSGTEISAELAKEAQNYLTTSPLLMEKKSKSGLREVDITTMIHSLDAEVLPDGVMRIRAILSASGADYLNPDYLLRALREKFGTRILCGDALREETSILRTHVYLSDGVTEFR